MTSVQISKDNFPKIAYQKIGSGNALVLLHGFPERGSLWNRVSDALSKHFLVIIPDIPGSGASALPTTTVTLPILASSIKAILDNEKITEVVLAGHSMGGYIALAFAEQYPEMIKGLSLVHSTATADDEERIIKRKRTIEIIQKGGKNAFMRELIPGFYSPRFKENNQSVIATQIERGIELADESIIAFYSAMMQREDRRIVVQQLAAPFQMIIGKEETIAPMKVLLEHAALANISFVHRYDDCVHMSMIEQPKLLTYDLINFTEYCYKR